MAREPRVRDWDWRRPSRRSCDSDRRSRAGPHGPARALIDRHVGPTCRRPARPARRSRRTSTPPCPVLASCAAMKQILRALPCSQVRFEITLPSATSKPPAVIWPLVHFRFPAQLAGLRVERHQESRRERREVDQCPRRYLRFLLRAARGWTLGGIVAAGIPNACRRWSHRTPECWRPVR